MDFLKFLITREVGLLDLPMVLLSPFLFFFSFQLQRYRPSGAPGIGSGSAFETLSDSSLAIPFQWKSVPPNIYKYSTERNKIQ